MSVPLQRKTTPTGSQSVKWNSISKLLKNYQANIRNEALEQKRKQRRISAHYGLVCSSLCIIRESIENSPAITNTNTNITYDDRLNNNYGNKGIHYHLTEKAHSQNQVKSFSGQAIYILFW